MTSSRESGGGGTISGVLQEGMLVLVCGGLVALAANWLSPRGLSLTRDYFPGSDGAAVPEPRTPGHADANSATAHLKAKGFQVADHDQAVRFFRDPQREQELIIFVDARDEPHYSAGHVPGAYAFDHFHPETRLSDLLPVCLTAQTIVIYCTGGNCEDSEFAAVTLREAGVANEKLVVYPGGITEWQTRGLPLESGPRNSGNLHPEP